MSKRALAEDLAPALAVARSAIAAVVPDLITAAEVARHWRITTASIPNWVRRGWLPKPTIAPNGRAMFPTSVLESPSKAESLLDGIELELEKLHE